MKSKWDTEASKELQQIAGQSREAASDVGQIYCMLKRIESKGLQAGIPCSQHSTTKLYWWPVNSITVFFGVKYGELYVAHAAITNTQFEFDQAEAMALKRYNDY